jgi:hypothetical protein
MLLKRRDALQNLRGVRREIRGTVGGDDRLWTEVNDSDILGPKYEIFRGRR